MVKPITLGADPEIFLADAAGAFISAIGKIGGTKEQPRPLLEIGEGFAVQEDNVALEYNIPPSPNKDAFRGNISRAMSYLSDHVGKMGLKLINVSATSFPVEQLRDPRALEFGCDPDFNAWKNGKPNPRPNAKDKTLRSCGGHVHVGYAFQSADEVHQFIKLMDLYLGVPSVLMDQGELRKQLYGKAGAFRYKPYGCEYRSLSNFWTFSDKTIDWVWDSTRRAADALQNNMNIDEDGGLILEAVDHNNKLMAERLVDKYKLLVV